MSTLAGEVQIQFPYSFNRSVATTQSILGMFALWGDPLENRLAELTRLAKESFLQSQEDLKCSLFSRFTLATEFAAASLQRQGRRKTVPALLNRCQ